MEPHRRPWIGAFDDPLATATFGRRYVFARLDQRTFVAGLRLNWTFTPRLSLQLYAQPLVSSGDYSGFGELARPASYDFHRYAEGASTFHEATHQADPDGPGPAPAIDVGNPDFGFRSLRGNAVLRWEFGPRSTLYCVWTQSRQDEEDVGRFELRRSIGRLASARADNIFLVKLAYGWNR